MTTPKPLPADIEARKVLMERLMDAAREYAAANPDVEWSLIRTTAGLCWTNLAGNRPLKYSHCTASTQ